jgi:hypothetical protein
MQEIKDFEQIPVITTFKSCICGSVVKPRVWTMFYDEETSIDRIKYDGAFFVKNNVQLSAIDHCRDSVFDDARWFFDQGYTYEAYFSLCESKLLTPYDTVEHFDQLKLSLLSFEKLEITELEPTFENLLSFVGKETAARLREDQFTLQHYEIAQVAEKIEDPDLSERVGDLALAFLNREPCSGTFQDGDEINFVIERFGIWIPTVPSGFFTDDLKMYLEYKEELLLNMIQNPYCFCLISDGDFDPGDTKLGLVWPSPNLGCGLGTGTYVPGELYSGYNLRSDWDTAIANFSYIKSMCCYSKESKILYCDPDHEGICFDEFVRDFVITRFSFVLGPDSVFRILTSTDLEVVRSDLTDNFILVGNTVGFNYSRFLLNLIGRCFDKITGGQFQFKKYVS